MEATATLTDSTTTDSTSDAEFAPQPGPQTEFLRSTASITFYGGAFFGGKSYALLLDQMRWHETPKFRGVIFRRNSTQLTMGGGLWDEAQAMFDAAGGKANGTTLTCRFPSGAAIGMRHCEHEKSKYIYKGLQADVIGFDQLEDFTASQFFYIISRNRGRSGIIPYVRATYNPQPGWLADFLQWWWDKETGFAIPERAGVIRWFVRVRDVVYWADDPQELIDKFPGVNVLPKSVTLIPAKAKDNPIGLAGNPGYLATLEAMREVERQRGLLGNHLIRDDEGLEWPAKYFLDIWVDKLPHAFQYAAIAIDPAKGNEKGCDCPDVFCGWDGHHFYIWADCSLRPVEEAAVSAVDKACEYPVDLIHIEGNGMQYLAGGLVKSELIERGLGHVLVRTPSSTEKKEDRIRKLGARLKAGQIKFLDTPGGRRLVDQTAGFPLDPLRDGPDCLEMAIRTTCDVGQSAAGARHGQAMREYDEPVMPIREEVIQW